jgi:hypothetical protein
MEEVLPPQTESGAGFESTAVRQFTIFMENRVGKLQALVRGYEGHDGRIVGLMVQNSADTALVRMICSDPDLAREVLTSDGFSFTEQELLVVMLPRRAAHPLLQISAALLAAEINIHYMYPLLISPKGPALALYVDDRVLASQLFIRKGFTLLAESDLAQLGGRGNSGENN